MSAPSTWQETNNRYLADRMTWLRSRLEQHARLNRPRPAPVGPQPPESEESKSFWRGLLRKDSANATAKAHPILLAESSVANREETETHSVSKEPSDASSSPPALTILSKRFGLTAFEQDILLLCAAMELDISIGGLCAYAQDDAAKTYPTFALAFTIFDDPSWDAMCPERPLRYWRLIEIHQPGGQPLNTSSLRADERIVNYLKGLNYLDDRLAPLFAVPDLHEGGEVSASQRVAVDTIVMRLKQTRPGQPLPTIQLLGSDGPSKQLIAEQAAASLGLNVYRLHSYSLSANTAEIESIARLWQRESSLLPLGLYLDTQAGEDNSAASPTAGTNRFLSRINCVTFLDTRDVWPSLAHSTLVVDVSKPTAAEQKAAWATALGASAAVISSQLAGQFNLGLSSIHEIAARVLAEPALQGPTVEQRLWDACLADTRPRLDAMAQRLDPRATWDDIVLPPPEMKLLQQIADQVGQRATVYQEWGFGGKMTRGLGISALFAGESGTGKTMAAEVLANHLRLNLYRIDLSAVVSKYIGETEKNLRRLFDAAEDGGAILFFDEADALFGKRSEVKDSHDRYANIEINYLLQRMEAYRGLAILATNMKSALDQAFLRRLRFIVNLPFPGPAERKAIWQRAFPKQTPVEDLDYDRLARLTIPGGNIHNIALNAAFLAAQSGGPVTMQLVLDAARTELRKLDRPIVEADFRLQAAAPGANAPSAIPPKAAAFAATAGAVASTTASAGNVPPASTTSAAPDVSTSSTRNARPAKPDVAAMEIVG
jgi:hypothetical protein